MSSFRYGKHTEKHIGVWLRIRSNPDVYMMKKEEYLNLNIIFI